MHSKKVYFSKSSVNILNIKKNFIKDDKILTLQAQEWNKYYSQQPRRTKCKICGTKLPKIIFKSHFADYTVCKNCGHLNGLNKDTKKFNNYLYKDSKGIKFSKFYITNYKERVKNIYKPKLQFLKKILKEKIEILEFGAGAGHFLKACEAEKISGIGYDVNQTMVSLGNRMLKKNKINYFNIDDIYEYILNADNEVITILGVIEHLEHPNLIFKNFKKSKAKYLFFSVPTFSLSTILEHTFQNFYPRVLGGIHNHLYSEESIKYITNKYKLKIIGEWWFGTDIMDLMRVLKIYSKPHNEKAYNKYLNKYFIQVMDDLQSVLDKKKICGDVHMVLSK